MAILAKCPQGGRRWQGGQWRRRREETRADGERGGGRGAGQGLRRLDTTDDAKRDERRLFTLVKRQLGYPNSVRWCDISTIQGT